MLQAFLPMRKQSHIQEITRLEQMQNRSGIHQVVFYYKNAGMIGLRHRLSRLTNKIPSEFTIFFCSLPKNSLGAREFLLMKSFFIARYSFTCSILINIFYLWENFYLFLLIFMYNCIEFQRKAYSNAMSKKQPDTF